MFNGVTSIAELINRLLALWSRLRRNYRNAQKQAKIDAARRDPSRAIIDHFSDGMCNDADDAVTPDKTSDSDRAD